MTIHDLKKSLATALSIALAVPAGVAPALAADAAAPAEFRGVDVADDQVTIKLSTSVLYNSFLTQKPPRLVVELLDTRHLGPSGSAKGAGSLLAAVRTSQFERAPKLVTRVVMDLVKMAGYKIDSSDKGLVVSLVTSVEDATTTTVAPAAATAAAGTAAPAPDAPKLAENKPAPKIIAKRAARAAAAKPEPVVAPEPASAGFPPAAAAAPVAVAPAPAAVVPPPAPAAVAVPVKKRPRIETNAYQAMKKAGLDKTMAVELAAAAQESNITKEKPAPGDDVDLPDEGPRRGVGYRDIMSRLPRDRVSFEFENMDIRDILKLMSAKAKINIVFGSDVGGALSLRLDNVPFNEAFRTVLSMMKLTTDQVGDTILRVITPTELKAQRTSSTNITRTFTLNYAKAAEVRTAVDGVRTAEGRTGSSIADIKTNTIIVTDTLEGLLATEALINQLDQRPRQVLIEAKLVEVNLNNQINYGVQWDYMSLDRGKVGGQQGITSVGTTAGFTDATIQKSGGALDLNAENNVTTTGGIGAAGRGTGVSLAADRIFGALTFGRITNNFVLNATLNAAASEGKAKVLSEPKIATLNNQSANINVTTQIPYVTSNVAATGVQTQTVSYVQTGIQLTVTPSINADGRITLLVNPLVSQPSTTASGSTATGAPAIDSRQANTTVLVRDGETIVIGGLIADTLQDTVSKIPLLGDIPVLGWLFKKKTKSRVRAELLIFVTTRIMAD